MTEFTEINVTSDILLREIGLQDIEPIFETINSERDYLGEWLPFVEVTLEISDTQNFVEKYLELEDRELTLVIYFKNQFAGLIGLKDTDIDNKKTEIGYWLSEKFQHNGIITLSCKALISFLFEKLNLNRVQIKAATENYRSQHIPERLGFTKEGTERKGELLSRGFVDLFVYGLLKDEYTQHLKS